MATDSQPGYDALADVYDAAFPTGFTSSTETFCVDLFATSVGSGEVIDVGCGTGHVTNRLHHLGLNAWGLDPAPNMLRIARARYPKLRFEPGDALLQSVDGPVAALVGRFSLIHVAPGLIDRTFARWREVVADGGRVLLAFHCADEPADVQEFNHRVARAWRWRPDQMAQRAAKAGFYEEWRFLSTPDANHRFSECHLSLRA